MSEGIRAFEVQRDGLGQTRIAVDSLPVPDQGEALLRVDGFAFTANNVTYGVAGDAVGYWNFFPAQDADAGWGRIPVWGFGDVVASAVDGVAEGERFYGYYPMASHLLVRPDQVGERGFVDATRHRAGLPAVYNDYIRTSTDQAYRADREALQMLFRPLFLTSFFLDDWLLDNDFFGADVVVLTSASSKTALGLAWLLHTGRRDRCRVVGLTSAANAAFVRSLGCYDEVVLYDDVTSLPVEPAVLVDMAGNTELRARLHHHLADALRYSCSVGLTHWEKASLAGNDPLPGPRPILFFAPEQIDKRSAEWGPRGVAERTAAAWEPFVAAVEGWIDVRREQGPDAVAAVYQDFLENRARPSAGFVLSL